MFPIIPANSAAVSGNQEGVIAYGRTTGDSNISISNLISNAAVISSDVTGVGTARRELGSCEYSSGKDKAIFAYGNTPGTSAISNLVSNTGVVATDTAGVGTARYSPGGCSYG